MSVAHDVFATAAAGVSRVVDCIGAQKAGTTRLYDPPRRNADVPVPLIKEVHCWDTVPPPRVPDYAEVAVHRAGLAPRGAMSGGMMDRRRVPVRRARQEDGRNGR